MATDQAHMVDMAQDKELAMVTEAKVTVMAAIMNHITELLLYDLINYEQCIKVWFIEHVNYIYFKIYWPFREPVGIMF